VADATDRYAQAAPLLQRALVIAEKALGADHPFSRMVRQNLATLRESLAELPPDHQPPTTSLPGTAP
jgi:hypothetical protein